MRARQLEKFIPLWEAENGTIFRPIRIKVKPLCIGFAGFCYNKKNYICIEIAKGMTDAQQVQTLFHELAHAKQYDDGRLKIKRDYFIWNGKINTLPYERQPWEIEANHIEATMVARMMH